jgi:hypothetical protein
MEDRRMEAGLETCLHSPNRTVSTTVPPFTTSLTLSTL